MVSGTVSYGGAVSGTGVLVYLVVREMGGGKTDRIFFGLEPGPNPTRYGSLSTNGFRS